MSERLEYQANFLRATRGHGAHDISSHGLFDMHKIYVKMDETIAGFQKFQIADLEEVAVDIRMVGTPHALNPTKPMQSEHYIFRSNLKYLSNPTRAIVLENVYFSYDVQKRDNPSFYFFTQDYCLVNGMFFGAEPFLEAPNAIIESPASFADDFFVSFNICHLLFDKYPRAYIAQRDFGANIALLFFGNEYTGALGGLAGMQFAPLASLQRRGTVFLRKCICFSNSVINLKHPTEYGNVDQLEALDSLRNKAKGLALGRDTVHKRLFIKRAPGLPRSIVNMPEVDAVLDRYCFTAIDPAALSPNEQFVLFGQVQDLAGVHGAGLANQVFMSKGSTVIELLPPLCASKAYWLAGSFLEHRYEAVTCLDPVLGDYASIQSVHDSKNNRRDVIVMPERLESVLQCL
jgi:hypothetical protein